MKPTKLIGCLQQLVLLISCSMQDAKVVDSACLALHNIAESYASKPNLLGMLSSGGVIQQVLQMVRQNQQPPAICTVELCTQSHDQQWKRHIRYP